MYGKLVAVCCLAIFTSTTAVDGLENYLRAVCDAFCGQSSNVTHGGGSGDAAASNTCTKTDLVCIGQVQVATVTASSTYGTASLSHGPENSCIGHQQNSTKTGSWTAKKQNKNQWIQADFGRNLQVTAVSTQGRDGADQWVTSYYISYKLDGEGAEWQAIDELYTGNADRDTIVTNQLPESGIIARYVRLRPETWNGYISLRWNLEGCEEIPEA